MKIFKYLFFLLLIVIIAGSIYIATKDGEFQIEETKVIPAPAEMVFNEVNDFKNWENWGPWASKDKDIIIEYGAKTSGDSALYSWKSSNFEDGKIKTISAKPFAEIKQGFSFETSFGTANSDLYWNFDEFEEGTEVTWGIKGKQNFMEKLAFIFKDETIPQMMRPKLKRGLEKLETVILNKMDKYTINVDGIIRYGGGYYMYTTTASKIGMVDRKMAPMLSEVSSYMEENNIEKNGNPFVLYNEWNNDAGTVIFSAGFFTPSEVITPAKSEVLTGFMPNQKVLKTTLKGDYENLREAWSIARDYLEKNNIEIKEDAHSFEVYQNSPNKVANPAKLVTHLYIPVK